MLVKSEAPREADLSHQEDDMYSIRLKKSQDHQYTLHKLRAKQGAKPLYSHQHQ